MTLSLPQPGHFATFKDLSVWHQQNRNQSFYATRQARLEAVTTEERTLKPTPASGC